MKKVLLSVLAIAALSFTSCSDNDENVSTEAALTLNIQGLENLGANFKYEGWIIVGDSPVSTGVFSVDDSGVLSKTSFTVDKEQLKNAAKFVVSIEPTNDTDPAPAATKILGGDFIDNEANVSSKEIVGDFSNATGKYILATPTDGMINNELSGVWFLDNSSGDAVAGLSLPNLSDGWKYEGWVVINGIPVSTGTFTDTDSADENALTSIFKGDVGNGPGYPGEDYIQNAPEGLMFPTDLTGKTVVISVEPSPDNNANPFTLKPLAHDVPADATDHTTIMMGAGPIKEISGTVIR
ncbi:anti-sigma factor [Tenacibaculum soleae]|uniref:anti-sigma factor n=1 Tax=Tenacibaculum soleae TaxID=447689 RepID=UPI002301247C|nr:anti-sigma factor [Tenacibaculum soleae]